MGVLRVSHGAELSGVAAQAPRFLQPSDKHVLMVSQWACIREMKEAAALKARGWRVDSVSLKGPSMPEGFDVCLTAYMDRMADVVAMSPAPIIHVHNEPDSLVVAAKAGSRGRPVVYDVHDLEYHRKGCITDAARFANAHADAQVHVGRAYRDFAYSLHSWTCPDIIIHSLPLKEWAPEAAGERSGVVYEGGVSAVSWRDFRAVDQALAAAGMDFTLYTGGVSGAYRDARPWMPYRDLLRELTHYTFGFLGMDTHNEKWALAYPNKLMEYAACGVIPVGCNAAASAEFFGAGLWADSMPELIDKMQSCDVAYERQRTLAACRWMDDEIGTLEALYASL